MELKTFAILLLLAVATVNCIPGSGIHDALMGMERKDLEKWALAAERYHKEKSEIKTRGGLHDRIFSMSDQDLREYIFNKSEEYDEINSTEAMNDLVKKYKIGERKGNFERPILGGDGGLSGVLATGEKAQLVKYALALEKYHNKGNEVVGGIHDQIDNWTREEVVEYIIKETDEHKEVNNLGKIKQLIKGVKVRDNEFEKFAKEKVDFADRFKDFFNKFVKQEITEDDIQKGIQKGIKFLEKTGEKIIKEVEEKIENMDKTQLVEAAKKVEEYVKEKKTEVTPVLGGIHDYVQKLSKDDIGKYIKNWAEKHSELNSKDFLEKLINGKK